MNNKGTLPDRIVLNANNHPFLLIYLVQNHLKFYEIVN